MKRTINEGDFILITDTSEDYYLEIGEVIDAEIDFNGEPELYKVRFGHNYETSVDKIEEYRYDLPEKCRVLLFENR